MGLRSQDLRLPRHGWGMAALRGAVTSPGGRYTAEGTVVEAKGLKQRPIDSVRDVPLAPTWLTACGGTWTAGSPSMAGCSPTLPDDR